MIKNIKHSEISEKSSSILPGTGFHHSQQSIIIIYDSIEFKVNDLVHLVT